MSLQKNLYESYKSNNKRVIIYLYFVKLMTLKLIQMYIISIPSRTSRYRLVVRGVLLQLLTSVCHQKSHICEICLKTFGMTMTKFSEDLIILNYSLFSILYLQSFHLMGNHPLPYLFPSYTD